MPPPSSSEKDANIQVIVRCRGRNDNEQREGLPTVVNIPTESKREIFIKAPSTDFTQRRSFIYDRVFGPEANQSDLFKEVALPLIGETTKGYNCTLFAYGQTGTGKTYTMEGDLDCTYGMVNEDSGIIPRTLFYLFDYLDQGGADFTVRLSYIELYNEELRDLLSDDAQQKLKIFEGPSKDPNKRGAQAHSLENGGRDSNKKLGVQVQDLKEVSVNSAMAAISMLQKGSERRRVAATRCNEKSSVKESTIDGEDVFKLGKLNLVDLAGSENIGRSGAENKRAREAGKINTSLLTLGRVIQQLEEHASYISYRDSNLTRLLQDSLGGNTKTSIIATIAPTKADQEETLSTLVYASRAKNIKNKPEVNQKITNNTLVKSQALEIERLRRDMQASRDRNGVYLSGESYQEILEENQSHKDLISDIRLKLERAEASQANILDRNKQLMAELNGTKVELGETRTSLRNANENLTTAMVNLERARISLTEQVLLTEAHATTESDLDDVASGLLLTIKDVAQELGLLHDKVERHHNNDNANLAHLATFESHQKECTEYLNQEISTYKGLQQEFIARFVEELRQTSEHEKSKLRTHLDELRAHMEVISGHSRDAEGYVDQHLEHLRTHERASQATVEAIQATLESTHETVTSGLDMTQTALSTQLQSFHTRFLEQSRTLVDQAERSLSRIQQAVTDQRQGLDQLTITTSEALTSSVATSQQLADEIRVLHGDYQAYQLEEGKLLAEFMSKMQANHARRQQLDEQWESLQSQEHTHRTGLHAFGQTHQGQVAVLVAAVATLGDQALNDHGQFKTGITTLTDQAVETVQQTLAHHRDSIQTTIAEPFNAYVTALPSSLHQVTEAHLSVGQAGVNLRGQIIELGQQVRQAAQCTQEAAATQMDQVATAIKEKDLFVQETTSSLDNAFEGFAVNASGKITTIAENSHRLATQDIQELKRTGQTPKKRRISYTQSWRRTSDADKLLQEYYEQQGLERPISMTAQDMIRLLTDSSGSPRVSPLCLSRTISPLSEKMSVDGSAEDEDDDADTNRTPVVSPDHDRDHDHDDDTSTLGNPRSSVSPLMPRCASSMSARSADITYRGNSKSKRIVSYATISHSTSLPKLDPTFPSTGAMSDTSSDFDSHTSGSHLTHSNHASTYSGPKHTRLRSASRLGTSGGNSGDRTMPPPMYGRTTVQNGGTVSITTAAKIPLPKSPLINSTNKVSSRLPRR